jgi:hypothetical protein
MVGWISSALDGARADGTYLCTWSCRASAGQTTQAERLHCSSCSSRQRRYEHSAMIMSAARSMIESCPCQSLYVCF